MATCPYALSCVHAHGHSLSPSTQDSAPTPTAATTPAQPFCGMGASSALEQGKKKKVITPLLPCFVLASPASALHLCLGMSSAADHPALIACHTHCPPSILPWHPTAIHFAHDPQQTRHPCTPQCYLDPLNLLQQRAAGGGREGTNTGALPFPGLLQVYFQVQHLPPQLSAPACSTILVWRLVTEISHATWVKLLGDRTRCYWNGASGC